jgi:hypothetical protein
VRFYLKSVMAAGGVLAASVIHAAAFPGTVVEPTEMREGPAMEFEVVVELPVGSVVEVLNCDADWCEGGIEDFDGFVPRDALSFGSYTPPAYLFPPQIAEPGRWHGRYYSREHFRYESRARWRDREGRRLYVIPPRVQPIPLRPFIRRDGLPGGPKALPKNGSKTKAKGPEFPKGPAPKELKKGPSGPPPAPKDFKKGPSGPPPAPKEFKKGPGGPPPAPTEFKKGPSGPPPAPKEFKKGPSGPPPPPKTFTAPKSPPPPPPKGPPPTDKKKNP